MPQSGHRHAHLWQTMAQSNTGEGPQIHFIEPRPGLHPVVVQVAPQSQFFRQVERQLPPPSDQGMLSFGAQGGTTIQHPDRYAGSDSSSAITAIQQQPTRGALLSKVLTQQLGNYMITPPQAMTAICYETRVHYAMTATLMQHNQRVDILVFSMSISTFDQMPLWILQRLAIASIDPSGVAGTSLLQGITP
jgi:hypothetical protein